MNASTTLGLAFRRACRTTTSSILAPLLQRPPPTTSLAIRSFSSVPVLFAPRQSGASAKKKAEKDKQRKRRKKHAWYKQHDMNDLQQFTLCEAIRYIKAFELYRPWSKYELYIRLRTKKDGPIIRNQVRLPHAVKTDIRVAVVCPPASAAARDAKAAGAVLVGEDELFAQIKEGKINFDRCIAVPESLPKIMKEGLARILGPRGLMPSVKLGTVVDKPGPAVLSMLSGSVYRERGSTVSMAVGRMDTMPEQLRDNIKAFLAAVKRDAAAMSETAVKEVAEVILSSTRSPGFSLNGDFRKQGDVSVEELSVA